MSYLTVATAIFALSIAAWIHILHSASPLLYLVLIGLTNLKYPLMLKEFILSYSYQKIGILWVFCMILHIKYSGLLEMIEIFFRITDTDSKRLNPYIHGFRYFLTYFQIQNWLSISPRLSYKNATGRLLFSVWNSSLTVEKSLASKTFSGSYFFSKIQTDNADD